MRTFFMQVTAIFKFLVVHNINELSKVITYNSLSVKGIFNVRTVYFLLNLYYLLLNNWNSYRYVNSLNLPGFM